MTTRGVLIVGGSVAGVRLARDLRNLGFLGRIQILSSEDVLPYDRPPLSKGFLEGAVPLESILLLSEEEYRNQSIELFLCARASGLDVSRREVYVADGRIFRYDILVVATGVRPRRLFGTSRSGERSLRTVQDSVDLSCKLRKRSDLLIVGGGFIAAEVAATGRALGAAVTILGSRLALLEGAVGREVGSVISEIHRDMGVNIRSGASVSELTERDGQRSVVLSDGTEAVFSEIVIAVGTCANTEWMAGSGLDVADGLRCDSTGLAVGTNNIFAVGDVASWYDSSFGSYARHEHWTNAVEQARSVAAQIVAPGEANAGKVIVPYFWSDQYGHKIQLVGSASERVEIVHGSVSKGRWLGLYYDSSDNVVGSVAFNEARLIGHVKRLVGAGASRSAVLSYISNKAG